MPFVCNVNQVCMYVYVECDYFVSLIYNPIWRNAEKYLFIQGMTWLSHISQRYKNEIFIVLLLFIYSFLHHTVFSSHRFLE